MRERGQWKKWRCAAVHQQQQRAALPDSSKYQSLLLLFALLTSDPREVREHGWWQPNVSIWSLDWVLGYSLVLLFCSVGSLEVDAVGVFAPHAAQLVQQYQEDSSALMPQIFVLPHVLRTTDIRFTDCSIVRSKVVALSLLQTVSARRMQVNNLLTSSSRPTQNARPHPRNPLRIFISDRQVTHDTAGRS